ncbi:MAG TPA: DUF2946 domain-containing protein [Burkholderiaceae bacterium]|nr:DUF2946 domain-containing protein [Burkholderiaceae bacterium]
MSRKSTHRALHIWIACLAILMNALAPSISHAVAFLQGQPPAWEICRADGSVMQSAPAGDAAKAILASDGGKRQAPHKAVFSMDDCGYCSPHAGSHGLLPTVVSGLDLSGAHQIRPFLFYRSPAPLTAWSASRPRGPPAA